MLGPSEYRLDFTESAAREFRALPLDLRTRALPRIDALRLTPRPIGSVKLKGHQRTYRIRIGDYRLVYEVDDTAKVVRITRVRHRSDVYR